MKGEREERVKRGVWVGISTADKRRVYANACLVVTEGGLVRSCQYVRMSGTAAVKGWYRLPIFYSDNFTLFTVY